MRKIRYAVVGLGHITQAAVLPAFQHAKNSELVALFSEDRKKLRTLGRRYGIRHLHSYDEYEDVLGRGAIDAVYISLPNHLHREYAVRAANCGVHVLCEKPMAVTTEECESMIQAARDNRVKLMIAYRLHFEEGNLKAIEHIRKGRIGEPRIFESVFTQPVAEHNIRLKPRAQGGGPLYDVGVYCINAARYLFQSEPLCVTAFSANGNERKFKGVEESVGVVMKFPRERLATFTCSFGTVLRRHYRVIGQKGELIVENPYDYAEDEIHQLIVKGREKRQVYPRRDQFAPELIYFSDCIHRNRDPEPDGLEGLADIRIMEAIQQSLDLGQPVNVQPVRKRSRPGLRQEIHIPPVEQPELVHAKAPTRKTA